jgi:hypothetical protein
VSAPVSAEDLVNGLEKQLRRDIAPALLQDVLTMVQKAIEDRDWLVKTHIFEELTKAMATECSDAQEEGMSEADDRIERLKKEICR